MHGQEVLDGTDWRGMPGLLDRRGMLFHISGGGRRHPNVSNEMPWGGPLATLPYEGPLFNLSCLTVRPHLLHHHGRNAVLIRASGHCVAE